MQTLNYRTPPSSKNEPIGDRWYVVVSCALSIISLVTIEIVAALLQDRLVEDGTGNSWHRAFLIGSIPASAPLLLAWCVTLLAMSRRPRFRWAIVISLVINLAVTWFVVWECTS
jgi:hypothetical protein